MQNLLKVIRKASRRNGILSTFQPYKRNVDHNDELLGSILNFICTGLFPNLKRLGGGGGGGGDSLPLNLAISNQMIMKLGIDIP